MHKNKITLFVVILFRFTATFCMDKVGVLIENSKKNLDESRQTFLLIVQRWPYSMPRKARLCEEISKFSGLIKNVDFFESEAFEKCNAINKMIKDAQVEMAAEEFYNYKFMKGRNQKYWIYRRLFR